MGTVIVCLIVVILISVVSELRIITAEKRVLKKAKERIDGLAEISLEIMDDLKYTYHAFNDYVEDGVDIELLIQEKKTEMILEEKENG